jgi:exopolyphosphatase/guanosine-5'-triphosphate,3'-diphosphate pyrophosphatase
MTDRRPGAAPSPPGPTAPRSAAGAGPVAALDCGTNSTRLLVVEGDRVLDRRMRITRLGQGVDATGRLAPEAIERTVAVLAEFRARMDELGVRRARMAATSAARDAANAVDFFAAAEAATGVAPELLSGEEEGRLSFAGATARLPGDVHRDEALLVCDIGGGSTELVVGTPDHPVGVAAVSIDVGCVRVTERYLAHDPPTAAEWAAARADVDAALVEARRVLPALVPGGPVIGLAGTVSTLAALELGLADYDRARLHHLSLPATAVADWARRLAAEDTAARLARPGMVEGRADVIAGGALVLERVVAAFERARVVVSEDDILDGLAASVAREGAGTAVG